jgi:TetR/AcrR family acrAB operon transcriptional repressor
VALAMWTMIDGMIRNWMFAPQSFDLIAQGASLIDPYLNGLRKKAA